MLFIGTSGFHHSLVGCLPWLRPQCPLSGASAGDGGAGGESVSFEDMCAKKLGTHKLTKHEKARNMLRPATSSSLLRQTLFPLSDTSPSGHCEELTAAFFLLFGPQELKEKEKGGDLAWVSPGAALRDSRGHIHWDKTVRSEIKDEKSGRDDHAWDCREARRKSILCHRKSLTPFLPPVSFPAPQKSDEENRKDHGYRILHIWDDMEEYTRLTEVRSTLLPEGVVSSKLCRALNKFDFSAPLSHRLSRP